MQPHSWKASSWDSNPGFSELSLLLLIPGHSTYGGGSGERFLSSFLRHPLILGLKSAVLLSGLSHSEAPGLPTGRGAPSPALSQESREGRCSGLGPSPDKVGAGQEGQWAQGQVGSGFRACSTCGHSWGLLPRAGDSALFLNQSLGFLSSHIRWGSCSCRPSTGWDTAGPGQPHCPQPPKPGCEPQDLTCNRHPGNVCETELGPASVSPACTLASAVHSHLPRARHTASCWGCNSDDHTWSLSSKSLQSGWADG